MPSQTKEQKVAEKKLRWQYFEERINKRGLPDCGGYDSLINFQVGILDKWIKNHIGGDNIKDKSVLELGSESGHLSSYLLNKYHPHIMITSDLSDSLIKAVPFIASRMDYNFLPKICILDNITLPFKNESFDIVISCNTIHHLPEPYFCIQEISRVLKKGGFFLFILEPFYPRYLFFLKFMFSCEHKKKGLSENIFSLKKWFSFLNNFEILDTELYAPYRLKNILPNITGVFKYLTGGWFTLLTRRN